MATGKRYYWIKLKDSFFTSDTVDFFMGQEGGANYIVLYQMLQLMTANTEGRLQRRIGEIIIPYDVAKIKRDCKWFSEDTIRVAMELYKQFGLIYEDSDGVLVMTDHENLVGSETDYADQKRRQKLNKLQANELQEHNYPYKLFDCTVVSNEQLVDVNGNSHFVDEKRYGGNGKYVLARANCACEECGSTNGVLIHHNNGYSNDVDDLIVLCKSCHGKHHSNGCGDAVETGVESFHSDVHSNVHKNVHTDIRDKILDKDINNISIEDDASIGKNTSKVRKRKSSLSEKQKELFDKFYSAYPRKCSVGDAEKAWRNITPEPNAEFVELLIQAIKRKQEFGKWDDPQFIPYPAKWLRARGWEDDITLPVSGEKPKKTLEQIAAEQAAYQREIELSERMAPKFI